MELLIPGLILVALMVYASTRIKRSAARAYEQERIETESFSITKPDGFLHPLNNENEFAFEAYSKEFGRDGAESFRLATASLRIIEGETLENIAQAAKAGLSAVTSEDHFELDGAMTWLIHGEIEQKGIATDALYKLIERSGKVFELKTLVLQEQREDYARKIEEMLESFSAK